LDLILDGAAELLGAVGAGGTTITAVAERTGLATSSIYAYVEGDRELIGAVAERGLERVHKHLVEILGNPSSDEELGAVLSQGLMMFLDRYESDVGMRQAIAFVDADPELMHINLADTHRNAEAIWAAVSRFQPAIDASTVLLLVHLSGALAGLAASVSEPEAKKLISEFERLTVLMLT